MAPCHWSSCAPRIKCGFVSDNAGVIAFDLPELMGRETWFEVIGHGYEIPKDGFGYRGVRLKPEPGQTLRVEVTRTIIARRLGRITGAGMFAESQKLGAELGWKESGVLGCDSVQNAVHRGKLFWLWGDTTLAHYPLGVFHSTSATTAVQPLAEFKPPVRLTYDYFRDAKGQPQGVAQMPGDGPTWISGLVSLPDSNGVPHLVGTFAKIRGHLEAYELGLCGWNEAAAKFERLHVVWTKSKESPLQPPAPEGQPFFWTDTKARPGCCLEIHSRPCGVRQRSRLGRIKPPGKYSNRRRRLTLRRMASPLSRTPAQSRGIPGANAG